MSVFGLFVCPSFRVSVDRLAISTRVFLAVWRSVWRVSAARSLGQKGSPHLFAGACLAGGPTSGLLPVGLPYLGLSCCRAASMSVCLSVCLSGAAWLPVGRSACRSSRRPSACPPLCRLVAWLSVCLRLLVCPSVFLADLVWPPVVSSVGMFCGRLVGLSLCQSAGRSILWCYLSVGWPVYWIVRLTTCLFFGLSAGPSASRSVCMVVGFPLRMDVRRLV